MLKIVSVSPTPANRAADRRRYESLAALPDTDITLVVPDRPARNGATPAGMKALASDSRLHVRAERIRLQKLVGSRWNMVTYPQLGATLARLKPDVIHVQGEPSSLIALQVARLRDAKLPDAALVLESQRSDGASPSLPFRAIERYTLRRIDLMIARQRDRLEAARSGGFTGHGMVIEQGVDRAVFRPGYRDDARAVFGAAGFTIGFAGRLVADNGIVEMLEAVAVSRAPISLLLMGSGPMRDEISDRAASLNIGARVRVVPAGPPAEMARFINALDALVLMPRAARAWREPFDSMIAEAQACGVPVIAAALSGFADLVGEGGWMVDEGDAGMLSRLLQRLAEQPAEVTQAASACVQRVDRRFSLDAVTRELTRAFQIAQQNRALRNLRVAGLAGESFALQKSLKP